MSAATTTQTPLIAASESFLPPTGTPLADLALIPGPIMSKLRNTGPSRIKDMRASGVSMQIVSHIAVAGNAQTCMKANDALYSAIRLFPDRFAAMALLPTEDAKDAARELQRCVTKYKFAGGALGVGERIDDAAYEDLWATAEKYRVPIALKETWPTREQIHAYGGNFSDVFIGPLVSHFHAAHTSSPLTILQLYASGAFDRHPNLRLIISQSVLIIASLLPRIEGMLSTLPAMNKPKRGFLNVWQSNLYATTEDLLDVASLRALLERMPIDHVLYASNYPFEERGRGMMNELKESGVVGAEEWERIARGNAVDLFSLRSPAQGGRATVGQSWH